MPSFQRCSEAVGTYSISRRDNRPAPVAESGQTLFSVGRTYERTCGAVRQAAHSWRSCEDRFGARSSEPMVTGLRDRTRAAANNALCRRGRRF
jgi:hypothetical protein